MEGGGEPGGRTLIFAVSRPLTSLSHLEELTSSVYIYVNTCIYIPCPLRIRGFTPQSFSYRGQLWSKTTTGKIPEANNS